MSPRGGRTREKVRLVTGGHGHGTEVLGSWREASVQFAVLFKTLFKIFLLYVYVF